MRRLIVALLGGAALGWALFWFLGRDAGPAGTPAAISAEPTSGGAPEPGARPGPASRAFASPRAPGLSVKVTRATAPEPGARVELTMARRDPAHGVVTWQAVGAEHTGPEGHVQFPARAGRYLVVATASDGATAAQQLDVAFADTQAEVSLALEPPALIEGQVLEAGTKRPIAGAVVRALPQPPSEDEPPGPVAVAVGRADGLGRFSLGLAKGAWQLVTSGEGFWGDTLSVTAPARGLQVELTRGVRLSGVVIDAAGAPVSDAQVRAAPAEPARLTSDAAGRFELLAPAGSVSVHAMAPDGRQALARVTLTEGQDRAEVKLVVARGVALEGLVRDDAAAPVGGAEVHVLAEPEGVEVAALLTTSDGRFAATSLPPGRYSVLAQHGEGRRAREVGVELPGAPPLVLTLPAAGTLRGLVVDEAGAPVPSALVNLEWNSRLREVPRSMRTGPDGRFVFDDLPAAELSVSATTAEGLTSGAQSPYVAAGGTAEVTLRLASLGRLVGTLTDSAITRVLVRGHGAAARRVTVSEFPGGRFELELPAGDYSLLVSVDVPRDGMRLVHAADVRIRPGEVEYVAVGAQSQDPVEQRLQHQLHPELGSGVSFENVAGGVRIDFVMDGCPAQAAGARQGDLVISIGGEAVRDAREAFERLRRPVGTSLALVVRRDGQDVPLQLR